jgi:BlaR1 peptidase M56/Gram-negative bacterial TonB protein C-terminal
MITYFVQVNVCWLLFYGAYFALLSRETFFRLNRIWLIISLLGGLVLPLIAPSFEVVEPTNVAAVMLQPFIVTGENMSQNLQNTEGSIFKILSAIYGLGVLISLGKLLFGFWKIMRLHNLAEHLPMDDFTLMQVREAIAPFSFFRWVFINLNLVEHGDLQQIIMHERAHVRERHSIDVVFAEILGVVFWWSPLVYFYTKSLKNVHEYAADAAVLLTSSPPQYGRLLLRQQQSGMSLSLTNPFFSQLRKRILMMTRNPSKRRALAKYAFAVPIFLVLMLLLASPKTKVMATTEAATEKVVSSIETLEKNLTTPKSLDNNLVASTDVVPLFTDTTITETPQMVFTLDGNTPSSAQVMSLEKVRSLDKFPMGASVKTDKGDLQHIKLFLTIVRIARKTGKILEASNMSTVFTEDMKKLVKMAEIGDTYQFIGKGRVKGEDKLHQFPMTYYIGERPTQPKLEVLTSQQQQELAKIAELPIASFGGRSRRGMITAKDLLSPDKLDVYQVINGKTIPVEILSFVVARLPFTHKEDYAESNNVGAQLNTESKRLLKMAANNDIYQFREVKCRVKGGNTPINAEQLSLIVERTPPQYFAPKDSSDPIYSMVEEEPVFIGGRDSMFRFLGRTIKYPAQARESGIGGTVWIGFIVEKDGSITDIKVKRNIPPSIDTIQSFRADGTKGGVKIVTNQNESLSDEAMRVVSLMPKWKAGKLKGAPVRVSYVLPIKFKLE